MAVAQKKAASKEQIFSWEGTDKAGKRVKGEMRAGGEAQVNAMLRRQGIKVSRVKKQRMSVGSKNHRKGYRPVYPSAGHHDEVRCTTAAGF